MIKKLLFILLTVACSVQLMAQTVFNGELPEGYCITVETATVHDADAGTGLAELDGYTTYHVFIECVNDDDRVPTVYGIAGKITEFNFTGDLFQADQFAGETASDLICGFFGTPEASAAAGCPECFYDSWVTIGSCCGAPEDPDNPGQEWTNTQAIAGDEPSWIDAFEGGMSFSIDGEFGGGWYAIGSADETYNAWAGSDLKIKMAQITTTGTVSGIMSFDILPDGLNGSQNAFECHNIPFPCNQASGCTDEDACNYDSAAVLDDNSCLFPCDLEIVSVTTVDPTCPNVADGDITVEVSGAQLGLAYEIVGYEMNNSGIFTNDFEAGTYTVMVTDNSPVECGDTTGVCMATQEVTFDMIPFNMEFDNVDPACYSTETGSFCVTVTGGTGPYMYSMEGSDFTEEICYDELANGLYDVVIEDDNGCQFAGQTELVDPEQLVIEEIIVQNSDCADTPSGEADVLVTGGVMDYTYEIIDGEGPQGDALFTELDGGIYTMLVTDDNECTKQQSFEILAPAAIILDFVSSTNAVFCDLTESYLLDSLGTLEITEPSGGTGTLNVSWSDVPAGYTPTPNASALALINCIGGDYTVTITDALGCEYEQTFTLTDVISTSPECNVSVGEFSNNISFDLYPNPSNGLFNLYFEGLNGNKVSYKVVDAIGRTVVSKELSNRAGTLTEEVNMTNEANGFYYLQVTVGDEHRTVKVVKQN